MIAQVSYLNYLSELDDRFEIAAICDVCEPVARAVSERYRVPVIHASWSDLVASELDVVMVLTAGAHAPAAVAAARAGKHVFVESPMCLGLDEGREMLEAAGAAGVCLMVGTMRRYDPAYERLLELMPLDGLRLVAVTTVGSPGQPRPGARPLVPSAPPPAGVAAALRYEEERRLAAALPDGDAEARHCYRRVLLDSLVHDLSMLRGVLGEPDVVYQARLGRTVTDISLGFGPAQAHLSWVDLPGFARHQRELAFYAPDRRVTLTMPSPYLRGTPSLLTIEGDEAGLPHGSRTVELVSHEDAFRRELIEFHAAITAGRAPRTSGIDGLHDVALCQAIARSHSTGKPVGLPSMLPAWAGPA